MKRQLINRDEILPQVFMLDQNDRIFHKQPKKFCIVKQFLVYNIVENQIAKCYLCYLTKKAYSCE